jgi:hypothetical protein
MESLFSFWLRLGQGATSDSSLEGETTIKERWRPGNRIREIRGYDDE